MRFTMDRSKLLRALSRVSKVQGSAVPILSNVLVRAEGDAVTFRTTDLSIELSETSEAAVAEVGATAMPTRMLYDIARRLPEGARVEVEGGTQDFVVVRAGRSRFRLRSLPAEDFPVLATDDLTCRFDLPATDLASMVDRTLFAVSTEESRYYLTGVHLHVGSGMLHVVGTNGHVLAHAWVPAPAGADAHPFTGTGIIIPRRTVDEVRDLATDAPDGSRLTVSVSATKLRVELGGSVIVSKLIDGRFPDYARVIPLGNDRRLAVGRSELRRTLDRVCAVIDEAGRAAILSLLPGTLAIKGVASDLSDAEEEVDVSYDDAPMEVKINPRYLSDILSHAVEEEFVVMLGDPGAPVLVTEAGAHYVVMPMR